MSGVEPEQIKRYLQDRMPAYLDLLKQMVAINSFTANPAGINKLGDLTAAAFSGLGFLAERVQSSNPQYGRHLLLTRPGRSGRKIGLISHLDTVFPPDEEVRHQFAWREENGRIYGPGTVDIKGGTVMVYMVLGAMRAFAPALFDDINWVVAIDASEEAEAEDFGQLLRQRLDGQALACLVFEAGSYSPVERTLNVVVQRKGMAVYRLTATGRASHAGSAHDQGANAIVQLAEVIQKVAAFTDYKRELTFNVGTVAGGTVVNRVPHFASAFVEMRTYDQEVYQEGLQRMLALDGYSSVGSNNGFACQVSVEVVRKTEAWPQNERTDHLFNIWAEAAEAAGYRAVREQRGGLSDGNMLWRTVPTLDALGPGGGNAHCSERAPDGSKEQEYVLVDSFVPKALVNTLALLRLASPGSA